MAESGLLTAYANLDITGADGPRAWIDHGGTGKARFGDPDHDRLRFRPYFTEAGLLLQPHLGWAFSGLVSVIGQTGQDKPVDLSEAYLRYRPLPIAGARVTVRAGFFWPPVSLEHGAGEWPAVETATPSAINSWIGEEVKVAGVETTLGTMIGAHRLSLTGAGFGLNDTSGTLLTFRGWALHDEKATLFGYQPLPTMNAFMRRAQARETRPLIELDNHIGWYAKFSWAPPGPLEFQYLHYDNRADPQAVDAGKQWGWRTRFDHLGALFDLDDHTRLTVQAMRGTTLMGKPGANGRRWVDMGYRSAFLLATRHLGWRGREGSLSGRIEAFGTRNHGSVVLSEDDEAGWAATLATRWPLFPGAMLLAEALHVESRRDARLREAVSPRQHQTILRVSLRLRTTVG